MNFLILTQYYHPETGAPQNRLNSLALNLVESGCNVEVLTANPNYPKNKIYEGYDNKLYSCEETDGIKIHRTYIYVPNKSNTFNRLLNYFSFVISSLISVFKIGKIDFIIVESPPLFLSFSAYFISIIKRSKIIFNVSDLWPESALRLDIVTNKFLINLAYKLESWIYNKSFLITGQTKGIVNDINKRFPNINPYWLPNGVDLDNLRFKDLKSDWKEKYDLNNKKIIIYAGIIGHAQALETIVDAAAKMYQNNDLVFVIVGDGPEKMALKKYSSTKKANILFIPNTQKSIVLKMISESFLFIIPLRDLEIFRGAIPSKIFDPILFGIPILLGVDGEARELFIENGEAGVFFTPEDSDSLVNSIQILIKDKDLYNHFSVNGKNFVKENFNRKNIALDFITYLKKQKK